MGVLATHRVPYTSDATKLLLSDLWLSLECSIPTVSNYFGLPSVIWPLFQTRSGRLDELYIWSWGNCWCLFWHGILFVVQAILIIGLPVSAFIGIPFPTSLCTPFLIVSSIGIYFLNALVCDLLFNGLGGRLLYSNVEYAQDPHDHDPGKRLISRNSLHQGERWIFINGVAVGKHWLQANLDLLAATFQRPILGIHNTTHGIPFDLLESIFQRAFSYATLDIRIAYAAIAKILTDHSVTKVVLISHSQGAIEASLVLDWLYCTMSQADLQKLEIYTFGNAMNHWNSPPQRSGAPAVRHIEHYANRWDWVSRFGILHFRPLSTSQKLGPADTTMTEGVVLGECSEKQQQDQAQDQEQKRPTKKKRTSSDLLESSLASPHRFAGRLFLRDAPGHMLNQHYIDNLFPIHWAEGKDFVTTNSNSFMEQAVDEEALLTDDTVKPCVDPSTGGPCKTALKDRGSRRKIGDLSRLFQYVNGNVPKEKEK